MKLGDLVTLSAAGKDQDQNMVARCAKFGMVIGIRDEYSHRNERTDFVRQGMVMCLLDFHVIFVLVGCRDGLGSSGSCVATACVLLLLLVLQLLTTNQSKTSRFVRTLGESNETSISITRPYDVSVHISVLLCDRAGFHGTFRVDTHIDSQHDTRSVSTQSFHHGFS